MKFVKLLVISLLDDWLAVIALLIAMQVGYSAYQEGFSRTWMPVSANVVEVAIVDTESFFSAGGGIGGTNYSSCLLTKYEYVVEGKTYQSVRYSANSLSEGCNPNKNDLRAYKTLAVSSKIFVWYDRQQPDFALRVREFPYALTILVCISVLIAIGMLVYLAKKMIGLAKKYVI